MRLEPINVDEDSTLIALGNRDRQRKRENHNEEDSRDPAGIEKGDAVLNVGSGRYKFIAEYVPNK